MKAKLTFLLGIFAFLGIFALAAFSQDETSEISADCDAAIDANIAFLNSQMEILQDSSDTDEIFNLYQLMLDDIYRTRSACAHFIFNNETHPDGEIGEVFFESGLYRTTFTSNVPASYTFFNVDNCGNGSTSLNSLLLEEAGEIVDEWVILQYSEGCLAELSVTVSSTAELEPEWEVIIERTPHEE